MSEKPISPRPATPSSGVLAILRTDILSSIIVFLVALPLCLGIAKACGVPPALGLITGIVGGLLVGTIAGSPLQVSGPAAGLIVLVAGIVQQFRDPEHPGREYAALGLVVLLGGVIQLIAGSLKLGQWFRAVAPAVIEGMLAGIGVLIMASQIHIMMDVPSRSSGLDNIAAIPSSLMKAISPAPGESHHLAAAIGVITILTLVIWKQFMPKKLQIIPGALVAVVVATAIASALSLDIPGPDGKTRINVVALPNSLWDAVTLPTAFSLHLLGDPAIWKAAVTVALVASAETLLCASAVDQLHQGPRTRYNQELVAQGVGNFVSGLLGALPMTGVIVRSSANVEAGARSRWSAVMHGAWLLLFVMLLPGLLKLIPTACLAGILVYTGFKLVNIAHARRLFRQSRSEFAIFLVTMLTIVFTDLLTGVITGIVLSAVKLLYTFSHLELRHELRPEQKTAVLRMRGAATFIRLPVLAKALERVQPNSEFHVDFEELNTIDHACLQLLMNWEKQHAATGGTLVIDWGKLQAKFRNPYEARV